MSDFTRDPDFGWDPWIGPGERPVLASVGEAMAVALFHGQDTLADDISKLTPGLDCYMSYVDNYKGWTELVARFGSEHEYKGKPWGYTSAGNMAALNAAAGGRDFVRWSAHYGHGPHVCGPQTCGYPQVDWTQWNDVGPQGQNVDQSVGRTVLGNGKPMLVSITIFGGVAMCADMEPGAMGISEFPHWYDHVAIHGQPKPTPTPHPLPPTEEGAVIQVIQEKDGTFVVFQETKTGIVQHCKQEKVGGNYTPWQPLHPSK